MLRWGRGLPDGTIFIGNFVKQSSNRFEERPAWTQSSSTVNIISISIYSKLRGNWRKTYIAYSHFFCISRSQMLPSITSHKPMMPCRAVLLTSWPVLPRICNQCEVCIANLSSDSDHSWSKDSYLFIQLNMVFSSFPFNII